jgi:hypothetical protein
MPAWIHDRAEHLLAKNPAMSKSKAFAIATQQGHKLGKNPKGYGTKQGKRTAKRKFNKPRKEYVKTPNPKGLESPKMAGVRSDLLLDQVGKPKVRPRRADAPNPVHRVKLAKKWTEADFPEEHKKQLAQLRNFNATASPAAKKDLSSRMLKDIEKKGMQVPGVFGMPQQQSGQPAGMNPAGQLAQSQKVGVPKLPAPKMKTMSMKTASGDMLEYFRQHPKKLKEKREREKKAFQVSQFSGVRGPGKLDYTPSDMKYAGPPPPPDGKKTKFAAMADELAKLNGVAMTPKGKLRQTQMVGAPKTTAPPGPSISELSKPVGYGTKAPGAVKGTI